MVLQLMYLLHLNRSIVSEGNQVLYLPLCTLGYDGRGISLPMLSVMDLQAFVSREPQVCAYMTKY